MFSFSIKRQNCGIFSVIDLDESVFPTHCESYVTKFTQVFFFSRLFLLLIIRICGITCCLQISQVIAIERTYRKRERERTQLMEQQFKTAKKKSTEIANNLPRANSILFLPAKRPFDGSLNPFFHSLRQARHGLYFPLTLALFS